MNRNLQKRVPAPRCEISILQKDYRNFPQSLNAHTVFFQVPIQLIIPAVCGQIYYETQLSIFRESNPGGGEIFRTCPEWPWGPPSLLYNVYRVFPGGKERPGRDADLSNPSSDMVKKK